MREIRTLHLTRRELETELGNGLRHRQMAKAAGEQLLPGPTTTAPALDPTCEGEALDRAGSNLVTLPRPKGGSKLETQSRPKLWARPRYSATTLLPKKISYVR